MNKPDISIVMPGIRPQNWLRSFNSIIQATKLNFELIIVSPFPLPEEMKNHALIKYVRDFGNPTRASQIGNSIAEGKFLFPNFCDDAVFIKDSIDNNLSILKHMNGGKRAVLTCKYSESVDFSAPERYQPDSYYRLCNAYPVDKTIIPDDWWIGNNPFWHREYFEDLGGYDCQFLTCPMAHTDLIIRAYRDGATVHLSQIPIMQVEHGQNDHTPVEISQKTIDTPLFVKKYTQPLDSFPIEISMNNWKTADAVWNLRFATQPANAPAPEASESPVMPPANNEPTPFSIVEPPARTVMISIIIPSIDARTWETLLQQITLSCGEYSFEMIAIGPNNVAASSLDSNPNFKYIKDFGSPSRCVQLASTQAVGKYIAWIPDDSIVEPHAFAECIALLESKTEKDGLTLRYSEGIGFSGEQHNDIQYWKARTHNSLCWPEVKEEWRIAPCFMYNLNYFKKLGGLDCRFEHVNLNAHDLAFRVQRDEGTIYLSPSRVMRLNWIPADPNNKTPIQRAYEENDQPLFVKLFSDPQERPIIIDYDNWKLAEQYWKRKYDQTI